MSQEFKHKIIAGALTLLVLGGGGFMLQKCANGEEYKSGLPVEKVTIDKADGSHATLELEIATKPMDLHVGLMFRKEMAKDHGMLFEFSGPPHVVSFWMKDTLIPLDMLFLGPGGKIVNIHRNAHPEDTTPIPSVEPVTAVIEINGGVADELGVKVGDKVKSSYFKD